MTFVHQFPSGLRCVIHVADDPPADVSSHVLNVRWSGGRMRKRYVEEYLEFTKHVNQTCADLWGKRIAYVVGISPNVWEMWGFSPNSPPELLKVLRS
jgi:hypothetical protein